MMRRITPTAFRQLAADTRAVAAVEFAIVAPTFLLLLFGIFDAGQGIYVRSTLQGALQDAGRDAGLESGTAQKDLIDQYVQEQVSPLVPNAQFTVTRQNYQTFSDVGRPEDFVDANDNGVYDDDECFTDENGNLTWDDDVGKSGIGGANDVVLYTVTVTYDRSFPLWKLLGQSEQTTLSASTTLRNQPYGTQGVRAKKSICPTP